MNVVISRKYNFSETQGLWLVLDENQIIYRCVTIELPRIKIPYQINARSVDCIPEGTYPTEKYYSPTKGLVFLLKNVPGRSEVEVHIGNYVAGLDLDSEGCILVGKSFEDRNGDGFVDVIDSKKTMDELRALMPSNFKIHILS
jgi:hypothetical protein